MCDYSLESVGSRQAVVGQVLVTHRFTASIGFIDKPTLVTLRRTWWQRLLSPARPRPPAVCIECGAKMRLSNLSEELQSRLGIGPDEEVTVIHRGDGKRNYRDGVRFFNGAEVTLQDLGVGVTALYLGVPDKKTSLTPAAAVKTTPVIVIDA